VRPGQPLEIKACQAADPARRAVRGDEPRRGDPLSRAGGHHHLVTVLIQRGCLGAPADLDVRHRPQVVDDDVGELVLPEGE
jgi:hypothetical protein